MQDLLYVLLNASILLQDKVNISVAIIQMSQDFGWNATVSGFVQSSFFAGYMATQIPGGYVVSKLGGRKVLPSGVTLWSAATAATPLLAGSLPGGIQETQLALSLRHLFREATKVFVCCQEYASKRAELRCRAETLREHATSAQLWANQWTLYLHLEQLLYLA